MPLRGVSRCSEEREAARFAGVEVVGVEAEGVVFGMVEEEGGVGKGVGEDETIHREGRHCRESSPQ